MNANQKIILLSLVITFAISACSSIVGETKSPAVYDPSYRVKGRMSGSNGIIVFRGMTQTIIPEHKAFCPYATIFKFNNGDIQVLNRRSSDGGENWHVVDCNINISAYQYPEPDGEVVMFADGLEKSDQKGVYKANFLRSKDNGLTLTKDIAIVKLPEEYDRYNIGLCRKIVRAQGGWLLMSLYGYETWEDDKGKKIERKARSIVIRSDDRGKTWDYLATVAFDGSTEPIDYYAKERPELPEFRIAGFEEPCLLTDPNGKIFCFIRTGTGYRNSMSNYNIQTPVYMSISDDGGVSWSNSDAVAPFGVLPDAVILKNGIMVVGYGRPGNWLMFSKDEGKSWKPIFQFYNDLYPPDCGNYISMAEIADNVLLVVYARTNPNDNWMSEIAGTYFFVNPPGI